MRQQIVFEKIFFKWSKQLSTSFSWLIESIYIYVDIFMNLNIYVFVDLSLTKVVFSSFSIIGLRESYHKISYTL